VLLVTSSYIWPLSVGVSIDHNYENWQVGYWPTVTAQLGGKAYQIYSVLVALVAALGLFNVLLCTSSRMLYAFAPDDMLGFEPLARIHSRFKTPYVSVIINAIGVAIFTILPFQALIEIDIVLYSLSLTTAFISLVRLRIKEPLMPRPYKIPLNTVGIIIFVIPPLILCFASMVWNSWLTKGIAAGAVIIGIGAYFFAQYMRKRKMRKQQHAEEMQVMHSSLIARKGDDPANFSIDEDSDEEVEVNLGTSESKPFLTPADASELEKPLQLDDTTY